jgi:hypothetical protein
MASDRGRWAPESLRAAIFWAVLAGLNLLRFWGLESSPAGFYVDEVAGATHVLCLRDTNLDADGEPLGLASRALGGGYSTAPWLLAARAWVALGGDGVAAFRSLSALFGLLAVLGIYFLGRRLGGESLGRWAAILLTVSPWAFASTRIAWDVPLALPLLIWGSVLLLSEPRTVLRSSLSGLLFGLAALSYPPTKVQLVLLLPALILCRTGPSWRHRLRQEWGLIAVLLVFAGLIATFHAAHPESLERSRVLSIASDRIWSEHPGAPRTMTLTGVAGLFLDQLASHFRPGYLVLSGDANLRHGSGAAGIWGAFDVAGLLLLLVGLITSAAAPRLRLAALLAVAYLSGIVPAALTWEGNPHALRSIGALPFLALLGALGWSAFQSAAPNGSVRRVFAAGLGLLAVVATARQLTDYFVHYPARSAPWFDAERLSAIERLEGEALLVHLVASDQATRYGFVGAGYFLMRDGGLDCEQARTRWMQLAPPSP